MNSRKLVSVLACALLTSLLLGGCVIQLESARMVQPWESEEPQPTAIYECRGASNRVASRSCLLSHGFGPDTLPYVPYQH